MPVSLFPFRQMSFALGVVLFFTTAATEAAIINVDIDPRDPPDDPVHSGDDGKLSTIGGTTWNHVGVNFSADVNVNNLLDEFGTTTAIDVTFDASGSFDANFRSIELFAGGGTGIIDIKSLTSSSTFDLAIYTTNPNLSVTVTDLSGSETRTTGSTFAIELPGDEGEEYVLFSGLSPFDLGGGTFGLTFQTNNETRMAGFQLRENAASAVVPEPAAFAIWSLLGGIGLVVGHRRRRKAA